MVRNVDGNSVSVFCTEEGANALFKSYTIRSRNLIFDFLVHWSLGEVFAADLMKIEITVSINSPSVLRQQCQLAIRRKMAWALDSESAIENYI